MSGSEKSKLILIDTNVWIAALFPWRPHADAARRLLNVAIRADYALTYAVHQVKDLFYLCGVEAKQKAREETGTLSQADALAARAVAWGCVENICKNATAIAADESDVWLARKYRALHDDFEDNLILAAARRANVSMLVSADDVLLRKAMVPAFKPEDALAYLELGLAAG